ncbi:uncharacterized protein LOC131849516 [Achroia grisella]|uniref:uncharacterized protein LOC131849516 n=1 Tax=Achroia grisella TaxID=688607 RepID=UPI0027D214B5|nr:uncharacterized protein LOC131849516 [Achroia grisella]
MISKCILFVCIIVGTFAGDVTSNEDTKALISDVYDDYVVKFIENGGQEDEDTPILTGGIWKCGDCENINESQLIYSESNDIDKGMSKENMDIQFEFTNMRCVTVRADVAGVVRRMEGSCKGDSVTLTVAYAQYITINIYGN